MSSPSHTAEDLISMFGDPDRSEQGGREVRDINGDLLHVTQAAWIIESAADPHSHLDVHLKAVAERLGPHLTRLRSQVREPLTTALHIARYLDGSESQGHGLVLDRRWIGLLAELRGEVDLDQYIENETVS